MNLQISDNRSRRGQYTIERLRAVLTTGEDGLETIARLLGVAASKHRVALLSEVVRGDLAHTSVRTMKDKDDIKQWQWESQSEKRREIRRRRRGRGGRKRGAVARPAYDRRISKTL